MKVRLLFSLLLCGWVTMAFSQSIGIIGSATPGGWDTDTDMIQDPTDPTKWSIVLQMTGGACKFRQDDAWTVNWGAEDFPYGTGTQGGADIPIPMGGEFTVNFNSATGVYSFSVTSDIGIIGSATPLGWDTDTNMFPDTTGPDNYTITLNLVQGACKFRQNDGWDVNWGSIDFPTGIGTQNGVDIPVPAVGRYKIDFNKATGAYNFTKIVDLSIGIVGSATPGGWDTDTDMERSDSDENLWTANITLTNGAVKFRANDAWTLNWGGDDFPTDTAEVNGGDIPATAGNYFVRFNLETLIYTFFNDSVYTTVGIAGDATPGGFDNITPFDQDPVTPSIWTKRLILTNGEALFTANNGFETTWASGSFPTGAGVSGGANIPVEAGEYIITFNSTTGDYEFKKIVVYQSVGLAGSSNGNVDGWNNDVDMTKDANDEQFWFINSITLTEGKCKFRVDDAWDVNWGLNQWPSGIGVQGGMDIPSVPGTYRVTLRSDTGEYAFTAPSSTVNLLEAGQVEFAPNPVRDILNITVRAQELQGDARAIVYNHLGQRVMDQNLIINGTAQLNMAGLKAGHYTIQLTNGQFMVGKSVVVAK
jgi:Secretion system C-terminal sorting domain/Outer membrane protein SusF_SusE